MKVILDEDILVRKARSGVEVGRLLKGVAFERMRWDGNQVVDLAALDEFWVRPIAGGGFELHAVQVPGAQRVAMAYWDSPRLVQREDGTIELESAQDHQARKQKQLAKAARRAGLTRGLGGGPQEWTEYLGRMVYLLADAIVHGSDLRAAAAVIVTALNPIYGPPDDVLEAVTEDFERIAAASVIRKPVRLPKEEVPVEPPPEPVGSAQEG